MEICPIANTPETVVIQKVIQTLRSGGLVLYPTETTYGIGADCENHAAVAKLLEYKGKRDGKALSIAVCDQQMAEKYVHLNETAKQIYATFLPGPVTVISKSRGVVAPGIESIEKNVGIRIPKYPLILSCIQAYGKGITATGANASYQKRPYTISDVLDVISDKQKNLIDLVLDAGELPHNEPSTVINTTLDDITTLRVGSITLEHSRTETSHSVEDTIEIGTRMISLFRSYLTYEPVVIALSGEMGAGKTHLVKGIAKGLGVTGTITSPTYTLSNEYDFISEKQRGKFIHVDTWRMSSPQELEGIGFSEMINSNAVICIEWADRCQEVLKHYEKSIKIVWVSLQSGSDETTRTISYTLPSIVHL